MQPNLLKEQQRLSQQATKEGRRLFREENYYGAIKQFQEATELLADNL